MNRRPLDLHFLSVRGGFRSLKQQTHLLKQMEKIAKNYKAEFVLNISEFGEDDPLMQNGTLNFPSLKVPWYNTRTSKGKRRGCFQKQIKLPQGLTLHIISVDTSLLQSGGTTGNDQLHWLTKLLEMTDSNWRIVVGYHPIAICEEHKEQIDTTQVYKHLHHIFLKFGVNAYLSKKGCIDYYTLEGGVGYIANPGPNDKENPINGRSILTKEMHDGFVLHRVSPFEIVSYFINSAGDMISKSSLHQRGKEVM